MTSKRFLSPVNLRKTSVPIISIYGDDDERSLTKLIWTFIPGYDVKISNPKTKEELYSEAYGSAVVFVVVKDDLDENVKIAEDLSQIKGVVADIIAITPEQNIRQRLHILSAKFDAIFNLEIFDSTEFYKIFLHKLKKGMMRLNARLQEDEYETFLGFLSVSADAFIVLDRQRRIFYVSEHYLELYPKSAESFVRGTPIQKVFEAVTEEMGVLPDDPHYKESADFWMRLSGEHEFKMDSGMHLRMTAVALPGGQGTIVSATNITAYKRQEQALAEKQEQLERALLAEQEASSLQKQFISMVSHEFRTPLAIVDGNAQIIERRVGSDGLDVEEVKRRLKTIRSAVSRTVNMMEAVLSSNLLKTGKMDIHIEEFNLKELITQLCNEQADLARSHEITLAMDDLPDNLYLDRKIMTLVMTNLLANAVKYTPNDDPKIKIAAFLDDNMVIIQVADNGVGIPQDELKRVFERFFRASTSVGIPGSGVGLSLVNDLINVHKGKIEMQSEVGAGTIVTLRLPLNLPLETMSVTH
jgi:signal transduction histidine kinase